MASVLICRQAQSCLADKKYRETLLVQISTHLSPIICLVHIHNGGVEEIASYIILNPLFLVFVFCPSKQVQLCLGEAKFHLTKLWGH